MELVNVLKLKIMINYNLIKDPKERLFKIMDRIQELKTPFELNSAEKLELENLEVLKMNAWSAWKDDDQEIYE